MIEVVTGYWPYIVIVLVAGAFLRIYISRNSRKTNSVSARDNSIAAGRDVKMKSNDKEDNSP